jgi:hypothetical protein
MVTHQNWNPYTGSGSIILAVVLFIITAVLLFLAFRLRHPIGARRPGVFLGITLVVIWLLSVTTFLVALIVYVLALYRQIGPFTGQQDPITPVTMLSGLVTFFVIAYLTRKSGFWVAFGSAIVGTIAAPMIFELPFDLIVMGRTNPPTPEVLYTLLFFLPLFLVELSSFAMLTLSPVMKLSRSTLFLLASMFFVFAVWALIGFAYPASPIPILMNVISKILAFATAISLFIPQETSTMVASQIAPATYEESVV